MFKLSYICLNYRKTDFTRSGKKIHFIDSFVLSSQRDFVPVTRHFFAPLLYILYAADFNYLIRWVIVTYILLDISVVNSHATSAYDCELLAVTMHYLPSVGLRLDNARSVIWPCKRRLRCLRRAACKHANCIFYAFYRCVCFSDGKTITFSWQHRLMYLDDTR